MAIAKFDSLVKLDLSDTLLSKTGREILFKSIIPLSVNY